MKQQTEKGHGYFRKSKAYGLVSAIALSMAFLGISSTVSAATNESSVTPAEVEVVTTEISEQPELAVAESVIADEHESEVAVENDKISETSVEHVTLSATESHKENKEEQPELALSDTSKEVENVAANEHKKDDDNVAAPKENEKDSAPVADQVEQDKVNVILQIKPEVYEETIAKLKNMEDTEVRFEYKEIFTGASVRLNEAKLAELLKIEGITKVERSQRYYPQMIKTKELIDGLRLSKKYEHDGRGMVIAVVDSGIDTKHKDLRLDEGVEPKIKEITKTIEGEFTLKVPHGYNFMDKNSKMIDETEKPHGMHISGILAGNATDEDIANNLGIDGMAPNAQLLFYKVFSDREDSQIAVIDDIVFAAIEDAIKHQADVISLSIGSYGTGKPSDAFYQAVRRAKEKGIVVVASMGNAGTSGSTTSYDKYTNEAFDQTDVSTTVSVAANLDVIGVGSSVHTYRQGHTVSIGGEEFFYNPVSYSRFDNGVYDIVDAGEATEEDLANLNLEGKVALIARTAEKPKQQFDRLRAKGVKGVISYNTNTGRNRDFYKTEVQYILEENVAKDIWGMTVSYNDGQKVKSLIAANKGHQFTYTGVKSKKEASVDEISGFSSWGGTVDLELKPEIVAPGENIYSLFNHDRYGIMSGTSMSTPVVAGASAILLPKFKTFNHEMNIADFTKMMMMNTANPLFDTTGMENSPRQQGAGMLNIQDAFDNHVLMTHKNKAYVALKEMKEDTVTFDITLENLGDETEEFKLRYSSVLTSELFPVEKDNKEIVKEVHSVAIDGATINANKNTLTLAPKEKATVTVTLTTPTAVKDRFVEGYIYLDSATNPSLSIPYFGYKGDWQKDDIIDRPMWEDKAKTKLTALMTSYSGSRQKYLPLGLKKYREQSEGVNPDLVAISSTQSGRTTSSAFLRMAVLRDLVDFEIDVVDKKEDDAVALTVLQRGNFLEKFRHVDLYENDYFSKKYVNPEEGIYWDGSIYDATKGEKVAAPEGQYYVRIKARNDLNKPYQYTYLPIKIDNTVPVASIDATSTAKEVNVTVSDNYDIWHVEATIGDKSYEVVKVDQGHYRVAGLPEMSTEDLKITVIDIAGNPVTLTHAITRPAISLRNLEDVSNKRATTELKGLKRQDVTEVEVTLDGQSVPVTLEDDQVTVNLENIADGHHELVYRAKNAAGDKLAEETVTFTRDVTVPQVTWEVETDEDTGYPVITNGYALIKGRVTDNLSLPEKMKLYYYNIKDSFKQDKKILVKPDAQGNFEVKVFLSDFPESVMFDVVDEANRKTSKSFLLQELEEEEFTENPISIHLTKTNNFLKEENLDDILHQDEHDKDLFTYNLEMSSDDSGYFVKINGSDFIEFDDSDELHYPLKLRSGANIIDIEGYDQNKKLILQRKYYFFVDIEMPKYEFENFTIRPTLPEETDSKVKGTIYIPSERFTFKGTAEDNGLEWSLFINDSIARRGKAWREFGLNKESFAFETVFKDNDFMKLRIVDYFGNSENDNYTKYRIKVDKEKPVIDFVPKEVYKNEAAINVAFSDNHGLDSQKVIIDGKEVEAMSTITGFGKHRYIIKAVDYAGNETILEGEFHIVGALVAKQTKSELTEEELPKLETWLTLEEGTRAKYVSYKDGKVTVVLSNGIDEQTVEYDVTLLKVAVPNTTPTVPAKPEVHMSVPNTAPTVPAKPEVHISVPNTAPTVSAKPEVHMSVPNTTPMVEKLKAHIGHSNEETMQSSNTEKPNDSTVTSRNQVVNSSPEKDQEMMSSVAEQLPTTGETDSRLVFGAAAIAILAGLGLVTPRQKEE